jgi:SAM-dependent methyltransferase
MANSARNAGPEAATTADPLPFDPNRWGRDATTTPCVVCDGAPDRVVGEKDGVRILHCGRCTLQYAETSIAALPLETHYGADYFNGGPSGYSDYLGDERVHRARARRYLAHLARHAPRPGAVLDVGCATGFFLDEARRAGWRARGVEVSAWAAAHARDRLGLDVAVSGFPAPALDDARFDLVTFFNVFEQLPDQRAAEAQLRRIVAPGGVLAIETWDVDSLVARLMGMRWHQYRPRETPTYYTHRSLVTLFAPPEWELLEFGPRAKGISLRNGFHILGLEIPSGPGLLARLGDVAIPYSLGDLVMAVFRRRGEA